MTETPDISIVISTYNRAERLASALERLLTQAAGMRYEVIAVDNNSSDHTREVIEALQAHSNGRLRYVFEGRQGVSFGRNAGVAAARAPLLAFTDDDMLMAEDWVAKVKQAFDERPELAYLGGKVLPRWQSPPPAWLTKLHWPPIALLDYGSEPVPIDAEHQQVLITANFAIRRAALEHAGGFSPLAQRVSNNVCSTEDHELLLRLWRQGARGVYLPELVGWAQVTLQRLTKRYHRHWHQGHGRCVALMCDEQFEASKRGHWCNVPAHLYRQTATNMFKWVGAWLRGEESEALWRETRLWFFAGYVRQRWRDRATYARPGGELASHARG